MIQSGFLSEEDRKALTALARDRSSPCRVSRRANALVLLDKGWSCQQVADALLLDDDTIRGWRKLFEQRGIEGITSRGRAVCGRRASDPCRATRRLLGAEPRETRDRADERASTHQHSRRDRPGDRANPDDRGPDHRRRLDDQAAAIDRGALSDAGAHPCFPGQRALSSRQARAGMASPAGTTHQAALHPNLLPALEPDRTVMGRDA